MANHVVKRAAYNRRWVGGDAGGIVPHEVCCIRTQNLGSTRYSNPACAVHADRRTRGYRKQHGLLGKAEGAEPVPNEATRAPLEVRRSWARLIRQVYEVDPLLCSRCGGTMKVIAVIEPACADTCLRRSRDRQAADRRPAVACLPAGRCSHSRDRRACPEPAEGLVCPLQQPPSPESRRNREHFA